CDLCSDWNVRAHGPVFRSLAFPVDYDLVVHNECDGARESSVTTRDVRIGREDCNATSCIAHFLLYFPLFRGHDHDSTSVNCICNTRHETLSAFGILVS